MNKQLTAVSDANARQDGVDSFHGGSHLRRVAIHIDDFGFPQADAEAYRLKNGDHFIRVINYGGSWSAECGVVQIPCIDR